MSNLLNPLAARASDLLARRKPNYSLPQAFYNDADMYALDIATIFEKEWLVAGMACEIPTRGSFITIDIGSNPVVIVRAANGQINAFHNVCRHRGSRLCSAAKGKVAKLVCPYHAWTYETDGRLLFTGGSMADDFDPAQHGLKPVNVRVGGGFIFICLSDNPPEFDAFPATLDTYLEPYDVENMKVAVETSITEKANWKLVMENNRECYHCNGNHPELLISLLEFDDTDDPRSTPEYRERVAKMTSAWTAESVPWQLKRFGRRNRLTRTPLAEGVLSMTMDGKPACNKLMGRLTSADMGSLRILHLPNAWNHFMGDHAVVFRVLPIGPQETMVTTKWLVHKDAIEGVDYDPENMRKIWDYTNDQDRRLCEENQRGINSCAYEPGPYAVDHEFGVIDFVDWYAERMLDNLGATPGKLRVVSNG